MDFLENKSLHKKMVFGIIIFGIINLLFFHALYGFHPNNDTEGFIYLINFFRGLDVPLFPNRYLNPFYGVIGSTVLNFVTPAQSMIISNIIYYFGLILLTYGLVRRVFKSNEIGFLSALLVGTSYAIIRYGLTQVQDIGGYFWFVLILYAGWRWWEERRNYWLYLGGVAVSFGLLTKESGAMGALFVGILFLIDGQTIKKKIVNLVKFSVFPFLTLIINQVRGADVGYNSGKWLVDNWHVYAKENYTFLKFTGVNVSTYNFLWIFILLGLYFLIKNWSVIEKNIKIYLLAVIVPSMSYFVWPIFISRTVFISAWLFVPVGAYGLYYIYTKGKWYKYLSIALVVIAFLAPYVLQNTLRYGHVFKIYDDCNKSLVCSWNYFWQNRQNFSKDL